MAYLDGYYLNDPHIWQYDGSTYAASNCTPTTGSNGLMAVTRGRVKRTGGQVRNLVKRTEETNPTLPGWSLHDLDLALGRLYPPRLFDVRIGASAHELVAAHDAGQYLAVQGDEDVFTSGCASTFDGPHCIGVHPASRLDPRTRRVQWWNNNPICPTGRWDDRDTIIGYAQKLARQQGIQGLFFGSFGNVPKLATLWGSDIPPDLRAFNPTGWTVGQAVKKAIGGFGTVINMSDLTAALDDIGHNYGSRVDPSDLQVLIDHYR